MIAERQKQLFTTLQEFAAHDLTPERIIQNMDNKTPNAGKSPKEETSISISATTQQYQQQLQQQHELEQQQMLQYLQQQQQQRQQYLQVIDFRHEGTMEPKQNLLSKTVRAAVAECTAADAYDADVDEVVVDVTCDDGVKPLSVASAMHETMFPRVQSEREHIYELFQPWALKTYGDQAKTKTITLRKKARILKALEGKEHSRPDSSKFRFWVKSKAFTTRRPEGFEEIPGSQRKAKPLPPNAVLSDNPSEVDLFVGSTSKDFGKRNYRKVAVVEEFFDIIYNVHMELGGRSGMHAGQKRTYRIITETYAFLPRESVTRFLSTCPECKKNLRPSSPTTSSHTEEPPTNESSSEVLNYSSHTESSIEAGPIKSSTSTTTEKAKKRRSSKQIALQKQKSKDDSKKFDVSSTVELRFEAPVESTATTITLLPQRGGSPHIKTPSPPKSIPSPPSFHHTEQQTPIGVQNSAMGILPKIRINPNLQRRSTSPSREPVPSTAVYNPLGGFDFSTPKAHESLFRYYEFMRRFYGGSAATSAIGCGGIALSQQPMPTIPAVLPILTPPIYGSPLMQSLRFPTTITTTTSDASPCVLKKSTATPTVVEDTKESTTLNVTQSIVLSDDEADVDDDNDEDESYDPSSLAPTPKKFKFTHESSQQLKVFGTTSRPIFVHQQKEEENSAINLSKSFRFSSNGKTAASTSSTTTGATLRIPQVHPNVTSTSLPPLDLERLKPITSTYLQLTRSMGLSDEDALRFDNLVSKDFKYTL